MLSIPKRFLYFLDHIEPFPSGMKEWLVPALQMLLFIPIGFLIAWVRRQPLRPISAALLATALALVLAAGKLLFTIGTLRWLTSPSR